MAEKDEKRAKDANPEVDALKESAEKYCGKREYNKAIAKLAKALRIAPTDADLYKRRGNVHCDIATFTDSGSEGVEEIEKSEYALAIEDYSAAIRLNPDNAENYMNRGFIYDNHLKDDKKALADYNQAIAIDPDRAFTYYLRGGIYFKQNQAEAAIDDFDKAINLDKDYPTYYTARGEAYAEKSDRNNAIADFREAIKLCNTDSDYIELSFIADKCTKIGEYQLAIDAWSECIKGDDDFYGKDSYYSYAERARVYKLQGNDEAALLDFNQAISIHPDDGYWYYCRSKIYAKQDKLQDAIDDFDKAISLDGSEKYYWGRGEAYEKKGDWNNAIADFCKAAELDPLYWDDLGDKYKERGDDRQAGDAYQKAIVNYTKAIELDSGSHYSYYHRAHAYDNLKNYEAAIADLTTMITMLYLGIKEEYDDDAYARAYAYGARGGVYYETGKYADALKDYNDAIDWYNKSTKNDNKWLAGTHNERALTYKDLGDKTRAKADFEMAVKLDPDEVKYREDLDKL
ncbi:hypothetical protein FACS189468_3840 [Spirochaetia bacterium]|nr:hypothetical protein FACS189468_3840 [Spirochaetia bacterium]